MGKFREIVAGNQGIVGNEGNLDDEGNLVNERWKCEEVLEIWRS